MNLPAGRFEQRIEVVRRISTGDNETGNPETATRPTFGECWASLKVEFGRQQLAAGRLESTTRGVITMRKSSLTAQIAPGWTFITKRSPYANWEWTVRGVTPTPGNREIEFVVEAGGTP